MTKRKSPDRKKRPGPKPALSPAKIALETRRLEALQLRAAGYTFAQIGEWLDPPCGSGQAFKLVAEACAAIASETTETAEHVRMMELQRLDEMMIEPFKAARKGDTRAIDAVLKIMDRRAKLLGLDAPEKQEHSGFDGGPIPLRIERIIVEIVDPAEPALGHGRQEAA